MGRNEEISEGGDDRHKALPCRCNIDRLAIDDEHWHDMFCCYAHAAMGDFDAVGN